MASNNSDITLKMDVDVSDAQSNIDKFKKATDKAFNSSDKKTQSWGNSLNRVSQQMEKTISKMHEMENTKVPTTQYVNLQKELVRLKKEAVTASKELTKIDNASPKTAKYQGVTAEISRIEKELSKAREQMGLLEARGDNQSRDWINVRTQVTKYERELTTLRGIQQQLISSNQKFKDSTAFDEQSRKVNVLNRAIQTTQNTLSNMENKGTSRISLAEVNPEQFAELENRLTNLSNKGALLTSSINGAGTATSTLNSKLKSMGKNALSNIKKLISSGFNRLKNSIKSTSDVHGMSFKKMLTQLLKYGFGIRSVFLLYKKLRTEIAKGLQSLGSDFPEVQADINNLMNSFTAFKASLTSAFQPIFSYVVPALVTLIDYLTAAMNAVANFFAVLTGQGYYYKATKANANYAKSVSGTGKAAKEANKELAEYDKLMVINQDNASGSGGGGGGSGDDLGYQWEKVDVTANSLIEKIQNLWSIVEKAWKDSTVIEEATKALEDIKSLINTIGTTFYKVFTEGYGYAWLLSVFNLLGSIVGTIGDIAKEFEKAWKEGDTGETLVKSILTTLTKTNIMLGSIAESFRNAWNDNTGKTILNDILEIITNISNTVGNLAGQFTTAWNNAGLGDSIMKGILIIVQDITGFLNDITNATAEWASELDFEPILKSIDGLIASIHKLMSPILQIAKDIYTEAVLPIFKKLFEKNIPELLTDISEGLSSVGGVLEELEPLFKKITPYITEIASSGIDAVFGTIGEVIGAISGELNLISGATSKFNEIWEEISPLITEVKEALKPLEPIIKPILDFVNAILSFIGIKIENPFTNFASNLKETLKDLIIPKQVQQLMDFFNLFSDNEPDGKSVISVELAKSGWTTVSDWVKSAAQMGTTAVSKAIDLAKNGWTSVSDWVKNAGTTAVQSAISLSKNFGKKISNVADFVKSAGATTVESAVSLTKSFGKKISSVAEYVSQWATGVTSSVGLKKNFGKGIGSVSAYIQQWSTKVTSKISLAKNKWASLKGFIFGLPLKAANYAFSALSVGISLFKSGWTSLKNFLGLSTGGVVGANGSVKAFANGGVIRHSFSQIWDSIPKYAGGTNNAHGTLFAAGEAGPEIVGHIGNRTEVLNKSQLAATMKSAVMDGMYQALNSIMPLRISFDTSLLTNIPSIALGQVLPLTEAFMVKYEEQKQDLSDIKELLEQMISLMTVNPDSSNNEPIVLQLDGRVIAELVWDETEKRYKQTGKYNLRFS